MGYLHMNKLLIPALAGFAIAGFALSAHAGPDGDGLGCAWSVIRNKSSTHRYRPRAISCNESSEHCWRVIAKCIFEDCAYWQKNGQLSGNKFLVEFGVAGLATLFRFEDRNSGRTTLEMDIEKWDIELQ